MYEIGSILGLTGTLRDRLLCDDRPPLVLGAGYMFIHIGELIRSTYHTHEWSEWEKVKPHYWEHAEFSIRYCKTCLEKEYNLTYLHCPRKKIKGEYCELSLLILDKNVFIDYTLYITQKDRLRGVFLFIFSLRSPFNYILENAGSPSLLPLVDKLRTLVFNFFP